MEEIKRRKDKERRLTADDADYADVKKEMGVGVLSTE